MRSIKLPSLFHFYNTLNENALLPSHSCLTHFETGCHLISHSHASFSTRYTQPSTQLVPFIDNLWSDSLVYNGLILILFLTGKCITGFSQSHHRLTLSFSRLHHRVRFDDNYFWDIIGILETFFPFPKLTFFQMVETHIESYPSKSWKLTNNIFQDEIEKASFTRCTNRTTNKES